MDYLPNVQPVVEQLLKGSWPKCPEVLLDRALQQVQGAFADNSQFLSADACLALLKTLKKHRQFQACVRLGDLAQQAYPDAKALLVPYLQGLIEVGRLDDAEKLIDSLRALDLTGFLAVEKEITGLKGRVNKQRMVLARAARGGIDPAHLQAAIDAYEALLALSPDEFDVWAGSNLIPMLATAVQQRVGDMAGHKLRLDSLKVQLVEQVTGLAQGGDFDAVSYWDAASAAEAELATGNAAMAELWLWRALACQDADPFSINSTLRQFREIHVPLAGRNGSAMRSVTRLIELLEAAQAKHGLIEFSDALRAQFERASDLQSADSQVGKAAVTQLEKVFGRERFIGFDKLRMIFSQCEAVGRVERRNQDGTFSGVGTGFLVVGSQLSRSLPDELVFITNAHVISMDVAGALLPSEACVRFELAARKFGPGYQPHAVKELIASLPPAADGQPLSNQTLDFSIVSLASLPEGAKPAEISREIPNAASFRDPKSEYAAARAYVLGHPEGDGLQISLHDSEVIDIDAASMVVHYRTPTLGGNSGSPVLNSVGKVFALHHAGSERLLPLNGQSLGYPGNEGMTMIAIGEAVTRLLS